MKPRFYYESDGDTGDPGGVAHYVVDALADPLSEHRTTSVANRVKGRKLAKQMNQSPPWPAWDTRD